MIPYDVSIPSSTSLSSGPLLQQLFVVGPSFSLVPAKNVSQIVSGKFIDLSDLLSTNIAHTEPESQVMLDGCLALTSPAKKNHRGVEDIGS